ncbi:MAG: aminotransferase class III-fold pyridoxal phosphate-dependent enzyme [Bdellovibrionaceae bacterium]|nr:aminotransferase class III-fold pyridoxal phosphate-dependent enzyme [Pseudobdellovibrionaceae bacterium]
MTKKELAVLEHLTIPTKSEDLIQQLSADVQRQSEHITSVKPPKTENAADFAKKLETIASYRGRPLYWSFISSGRGNGPYVECQDGSIKLDLINGIGVHLLGHAHPKVIEATVRGALQDCVNQGHLQPGEEYVIMSEKLVQMAKGSRLKHAWLSTCGTMANENALKMARQKRSPARFVMAMENAFAGRSTMMAEVTDNPSYKQGLPEYNEVLRVPFYNKFDPKSSEKALEIVRGHIDKHKNDISVFCFEPMLGEGGYRSAPMSYYLPIFEECKKNNIAIWADEVQTFMRTGEPFAFQKIGFSDWVDICTIAKTAQVAATLYTEEYNPKPGLIAGTFAGATAALSAGIAIIEEMQNGNYFGPDGKIQKTHNEFVQQLRSLGEGSCKGLLEDPDGLGLMIAVTPFSGDATKVNKLVKVLFNNGLMTYTCGKDPLRIRFLVPAIITAAQIKEAMTILDKSIHEVQKG